MLVPIETVTEIKGGQKRTLKRKIYPGYVMVEMDDGRADLVPDPRDRRRRRLRRRRTGGRSRWRRRRSTSSSARCETETERPQLKIQPQKGDTVKIKEGPFECFDGVVDEVDPKKGTVRVIVTIFGRPTPVELEYWQVEAV